MIILFHAVLSLLWDIESIHALTFSKSLFTLFKASFLYVEITCAPMSQLEQLSFYLWYKFSISYTDSFSTELWPRAEDMEAEGHEV